MRKVLFELALGSASISEEMQFTPDTTDNEIEEYFEEWRESQLSYAWYPDEDEESEAKK